MAADAIVDVLPAAEVEYAHSYDALVLAGAVYMGRWLEDARHVAERTAIDARGARIAAELNQGTR